MRTTLRACALLLTLPTVGLLHAASPDAVDTGWILSKLARPAPMSTAFVELRSSRLLKKPLRVEGEYQRPGNDTLVRKVNSPYAETSTIHAGKVTIQRGTSSSTYGLDRAPELAGLQSSFGALLSGDRVLLERYFRIESVGTRAQWTLKLAPREAGMARVVKGLSLFGRGAELRCIETQPVRGDAQRTLVAGAAMGASGVSDTNALAALCHGDTRAQ